VRRNRILGLLAPWLLAPWLLAPWLLALVLLAHTSCTSTRKEIPPEDGGNQVLADEILTEAPDTSPEFPENPLPVTAFEEVWAYLLQGRENALGDMPLSDLVYFGADINAYGQLVNVPNVKDIPPFSGRVHLVVKCDSASLTHFILKEDARERRELIAGLLKAAQSFDGLQIDFEYIPARDGAPFLSFLGELRAGLGGKIFSVALKARTRTLADDVYDYAKIKPLVDRIIVMAYDEHWAGSAPGAIAGMEWCRNVANYALPVIGREKLVMGLPFYGRAWSNPDPARAYTYQGVEGLLSESGNPKILREESVPTFEYEVPVSVRVYYEDEVSISSRLEMYRDIGVRSVGFWRLGQESPAVWNTLRLEKK
jgi:spore germination protein YaaH